ncbi:hypothetical protein BDA99DRAFT_338996 [Phascolomyces articulosus]|uniref:Uncharacterized protein n=1 Tax=Phascolomyces articulosus TaxID=60185 RepID=A0AAD5KFE4_9FUNG|nr:hypothetical protein BDA99DRAFT_338996 [Phascolomyces articulosus]
MKMYDVDPFMTDSTSPSSTTTITTINEHFNNLIYLHIDAPLEKQLRLQPILQRCLNLQYFIGMSTENYDTTRDYRIDYSNALVASEELLSWCPKLICFKSNGSYDHDISKNSILQSISTVNSNNGLKHLSLRENSRDNQMISFLTSNSDTIEHLELMGSRFESNTYYPGWDSLFSSPTFRMAQLRTLVCEYIAFSSTSLVALLNQAPTIHSLTLNRVEQLILDRFSVKSLHVLPYLRCLHLEFITFRDAYASALFFERFPALEKLVARESILTLKKMTDFSSLEKLKHLELGNIEWQYDEDEDENHNTNPNSNDDNSIYSIVPSGLFASLASIPSKRSCLETIDLVGISGLTLKHLIVMADIPTIKFLDVELDDLLDEENEEETLLFVTKLQVNTMIEKLTLRYIAYLPPYSIIEAISELPYLKELYLESPAVSLPSASTVDELIDVSRILPLISNNKLEKITLENAIGNRVRPRVAINDMISDHGLLWCSKPCFTRINDDGLYLEDIILERYCK